MDPSTDFGKEIPSRNLREKRSGSEKGTCYGFYSKKGSGFSEGVLRRGFPEDT